MSKGIFETIAGAALIAVGVLAEVFTIGIATPVASFLIEAGAGLLISGIGTMIAGSGQQSNGFATTLRDPIQPWQVAVGQTRVGGTLLYINEFGDNNRFLDLVVVLAAHLSQSVDEVLFDGQRLQIGDNNTSFTPVQQTVPIHLTSDITRVNDTVTVIASQNIPLLNTGDYVVVQGVEPLATLLNGKFQVTVLAHTSTSVTFTYLSGGPPTSGGGSVPVTQSGEVVTQWQDYGANVYIESINDTGATRADGGTSYNLLGHPTTLGETFVGMTTGTPLQGDFGNGVIQATGAGTNDANFPNPWTSFCSAVGYTAVQIRLQFDPKYFPGGIPQISFLLSGKNDISDPRTSPPTIGFTNNAALIIADYLANTVWGFSAPYGTEIDNAQLIAAANICDELVEITNPLGAFEKRYTCNGRFTLASNRGDILKNLLTSCAGRITYTEGVFQIFPGAWAGSTFTASNAWMLQNMSGLIRWRPTVTIDNRYNGVKGTYISPLNNWQSSDFPRYAQDADHGYNDGPPEYDYDVNLAYDEGQRRWKDIQLPFTTSLDTAQRLAKIELLRSLYMGTGTFAFNMRAYPIATLDVITVSLTYFGWSSQLLEVSATRFKLDRQQTEGGQEVIILGVELDVQETNSAIYDFELVEDLTAQGFQVPGVPNAVYTPDPPSNLQVAGGILTWTAPVDPYVVSVEGRFQPVASPPGIWFSLGTVNVTTTQFALPDLESGVNYIVGLRSINGAGVQSQWVYINTVGEPQTQWAPYQIQAPSNDALFPSEYTFDLSQVYTPTSGNDWTATATAKGVQPVNDFLLGSTSPVLTPANVSVQTTGGSIKGGITLYLAIGAFDSAGNCTPASILVAIDIPSGTNTNQVTLSDAPASITGVFPGNPPDGTHLTLAGKLYQFQATLTNVDGNILIGTDLTATLQNFKNAVNLGPGSGSVYASATTSNPGATITQATPTFVVATAVTAGSAGNDLQASGLADWWGQGFFSGGQSIGWPLISGLTSYVIYASADNEDLVCEQATGALTPTGSPPTSYSPTTIVFTGPLARSTWSMPSPVPKIVRLKGVHLIHGGVEGAAVDVVFRTGSPPTGYFITANQCIDVAGTDNWAGRVLAIIGRNNASGPFVSFNITAFDPTTGTFTLATDPVAAGVEVGDAMVVCTLGQSNSGDETVFTDAGLSNAQDLPTPHTGLLPDDPTLLGTVAMVIKGKSRGMTAHITGNGPTSINLDSPIPIDSTSVWIIYDRTWIYSADSVPIDNTDFDLPVAINMIVTNAVGGSIVVAGFTVDDNGVESDISDAPIRMVFVWGAGMAEVLVTADYQMLVSDQYIEVDSTDIPVNVTLPQGSTVRNGIRIVKWVAGTNTVTVIPFPGDTLEQGDPNIIITTIGDCYIMLPTGDTGLI